MIALTGAFIFAAQMINFPIAGATSGHFLGGAMASILFGPAVAVVIMSAVLIIQALVFQDGGLTVLGANIICTGVIGSYAGYGIYRLGLSLLRGRAMKVITFLAAWCSIVSASCGVALLLAWSNTFPLRIAIQAMAGWHSLIGIGEGLITALVVAYLMERNVIVGWAAVTTGSALGRSKKPVVTSNKRKWLIIAAVTLIAAGLISYFASPQPDGLVRVAENNGFIDKAKKPSWIAWIQGYELPGIHVPILKVGLAGIIGVALIFLVLYGMTTKLTRREEDNNVGESDHQPS
jgi:cobalt/nickel transport system permease protein